MESTESEPSQLHLIGQILLSSILPIVCSATIGFLFFRWSVLNIHYAAFEFVYVALVASVFFYSIVYVRLRNAYAVLLLLFLLTLLLTRSTRPMWVLRDFVDTCGIAGAVLLYERLHRKTSGLQHEYFGLVFSGILGVCSILAWSLQFFFVHYLFRAHQPINYWSLVTMAGFRGFFVGFGVGVGIVLNRRLFGEPRKQRIAT
jgi:uncharacterized membrane-anchored protein YitT (DUF2179 family)